MSDTIVIAALLTRIEQMAVERRELEIQLASVTEERDLAERAMFDLYDQEREAHKPPNVSDEDISDTGLPITYRRCRGG